MRALRTLLLSICCSCTNSGIVNVALSSQNSRADVVCERSCGSHAPAAGKCLTSWYTLSASCMFPAEYRVPALTASTSGWDALPSTVRLLLSDRASECRFRADRACTFSICAGSIGGEDARKAMSACQSAMRLSPLSSAALPAHNPTLDAGTTSNKIHWLYSCETGFWCLSGHHFMQHSQLCIWLASVLLQFCN